MTYIFECKDLTAKLQAHKKSRLAKKRRLQFLIKIDYKI